MKDVVIIVVSPGQLSLLLKCQNMHICVYVGKKPPDGAVSQSNQSVRATERVGSIFKSERSLCPASAYKEDVVFFDCCGSIFYILKVTFVLQQLNVLRQLSGPQLPRWAIVYVRWRSYSQLTHFNRINFLCHYVGHYGH